MPNHVRDLEPVNYLRTHRQTYEPSPVSSHKVHGFRRNQLGSHYEVALILPAFVITNDDHLTVGYRLYRDGNVGEEFFHSESVMSIRAQGVVGGLYYDASPVSFGGVWSAEPAPLLSIPAQFALGLRMRNKSPYG